THRPRPATQYGPLYLHRAGRHRFAPSGDNGAHGRIACSRAGRAWAPRLRRTVRGRADGDAACGWARGGRRNARRGPGLGLLRSAFPARLLLTVSDRSVRRRLAVSVLATSVPAVSVLAVSVLAVGVRRASRHAGAARRVPRRASR